MNSVDQKLLNRLIRKNLLTKEQGEALEARFDSCQGDFFHRLLPLHMVDDRELAKSYAKSCGLPFLDIRKVTPEGEILRLLSEKKCHRHQAIPIGFAEQKLIVAIIDASDVVKLDNLRREFQSDIQFVITLPPAMEILLSQLSVLRNSDKKQSTSTEEETREIRSTTQSDTHGVDSRETMLDVETIHDQKTEMQGDHQPWDKPEHQPDEEETGDEFHARQTRMEESQRSLHSRDTILLEDEARQSSEQLSKRSFLPEETDSGSGSSDLENDSPLPISTDDKSWLDELLPMAMKNRAEEIEIDISRKQSRVSMRLDGYWGKMGDLSRSECARLLNEVRNNLSPESLDREGNCRQSIMHREITRQKHTLLVTIVSMEDRTHVRIMIPSNIAVQQRPLRLLGNDETVAPLAKALSQTEPALILFTSRDEMASWQILNSVVFDKTMGPSKDKDNTPEVVSWRASLKIPGLNESVARDERELVHMILSFVERDRESAQNSDSDLPVPKSRKSLFVSHYLPADDSLDALLTALEFRPALSSMTIRNPDMAVPILKAALEPSTEEPSAFKLQGVPVYQVHLWRLPKLCSNCVELREDIPEELPEWYQGIDAHEFYEAKGCSECGQSGRKGTIWLTDLTLSSTDDPEKRETLINARDHSASMLKSAQIDIQDLIEDTWFFPI